MSAKITQDNLYMLLPLKIGWLAPWLSEDKGISLTDAINRIYHSQLYKKLSTESTKYWHLGPVDLYNELKKELLEDRSSDPVKRGVARPVFILFLGKIFFCINLVTIDVGDILK